MGTTDRVIRGIVGVLLILLPFLTGWGMFSAQWAVYLSVLVGLVLTGTAVFGMCPIYRVLGINTCRI
jgi:hypothetical protein